MRIFDSILARLVVLLAALITFGLLEPIARAGPAEAAAAFDRGMVAFESRDYASAAVEWERAIQQTPAEPLFAADRAKLLLDLSTAYERRYDTTGDTEALRAAKDALVDYAAALEIAYAGNATTLANERARQRDRLARVRSKVASAVPEGPEPLPSTSLMQVSDYRRRQGLPIALGILGIGGFVGGAGMVVLGVNSDNEPLWGGGMLLAVVGGVVGFFGFYTIGNVRAARKRLIPKPGRKRTRLGMHIEVQGVRLR